MNPNGPLRLAGPTGTQGVSHGLKWAVLGAADAPHTCVALMGFGAWLDPFEQQRFALLADRLNARVIVLESPGLGEPGTHLTWRERAALSRGEFAPLAARTLSAARQALRVTGGSAIQRVHVLGYSMGASVAAAITALRSAEASVASLTLIEPVAIQRWKLSSLVESVRSEERDVETYLAQTASVAGAVPPSDRVRGLTPPDVARGDQALLGAALCWGRIPATLHTTARERPGLPVLLVHGSSSALCRPASAGRFTRDLRECGFVVSDYGVLGGHGIWHSLPLVATMTGPIRDLWWGAA